MKNWLEKLKQFFGIGPTNNMSKINLQMKYKNYSTSTLIVILERSIENEEYETAAAIKKILDNRNVKINS